MRTTIDDSNTLSCQLTSVGGSAQQQVRQIQQFVKPEDCYDEAEAGSVEK
ncbi:MAG: hypothetical protein JSU63_12355 [Phycisphaerales bacterium]|nr:MAG: hypothetical protein JSU63_12355 [Phycisphaerales bacterium]